MMGSNHEQSAISIGDNFKAFSQDAGKIVISVSPSVFDHCPSVHTARHRVSPSVISNSPRVLRELLPELMNQIIFALATPQVGWTIVQIILCHFLHGESADVIIFDSFS